jgi:hypothetical protein
MSRWLMALVVVVKGMRLLKLTWIAATVFREEGSLIAIILCRQCYQRPSDTTCHILAAASIQRS